MMEIFNQQALKTRQLLVKKPSPEKTISSAINVQSWCDAICLYKESRIDEAIVKFKEVKKNAKLLVNIGCCYLRKNNIENATEAFQSAVKLDPHMAIGFFLLGLTYLLEKKFQESMGSFDKALELLRGNRFVDYRQLGFNYKLYRCEILTNKAVVAAGMKQYDEAKKCLLEAFECKGEKKHDKIFDCVQSFQSGKAIEPFIPPKSEVFRPANAAMKNVQKKDYLGTSKVISTDSMDDCYACFSGIKDQVKTAKERAKDTGPKEKKKAGPTRSDLLTELAKPNRKRTLRRVTSPDLRTQISTERRSSVPPNSALPQFYFPDAYDSNGKTDETAFLDASIGIQIRSKSVGSIPKPNKPLPQLFVDEIITDKTNQFLLDVSREIDGSKFVGSMPKPQKHSPQLVLDENNNVQPTSPLAKGENNHEKISTTSASSVFSADDLQKPRKITEEYISIRQQHVVHAQPNFTSSPSSEEITVDVQFSFVKKVRVPKDFTLSDLMDAVKAQNTPPQDIELCYNDDIGRQKVVSEDSIEELNRHVRKENKVYCFPARQQCNLIGY